MYLKINDCLSVFTHSDSYIHGGKDEAPTVTIGYDHPLEEARDANQVTINLNELVPLIDALTKLADDLGVVS